MSSLNPLKTTYVSTLLLALAFLMASVFATPLQAQYQSDWAFMGRAEATPKELVLGDRVDITFKVYSYSDGSKPADKLVTRDMKYKLKIQNPKPGQECVTSDNNLIDDGAIKGYCEAKGDPGNMEIALENEGYQSGIEIDGKRYHNYISATYNAMFNDPKEACQGGPTPPSSFTLVKQNDVAVRLDWQGPDKFVGKYEILYGNVPGEYTGRRSTTEKTLIIDSLDSKKDYYFKVQAVSPCKWTASSPLLKYIPLTGSVSAASEKVKVSPSPSAKPAITAPPMAKVKTSPSPVATIQATPASEPQPNQPVVAPQEPVVVQPKSLPVRIWNSISTFFSNLFRKK